MLASVPLEKMTTLNDTFCAAQNFYFQLNLTEVSQKLKLTV